MKGKLFAVLGSLLLSTSLLAQNTVISATVVDKDSTTWASGTWSIAFSPGSNASSPSQYRVNGAALDPAVLTQSGTMNSSGVLGVTIYDSSLISPLGSGWDLTLCPKASAGCFVYHFASAGASESLSTAITAVLPGPRFNTSTGRAYGYNDTEALGTTPGFSYYDVTLNCPKVYSGSAWSCVTGTGGPPTGAAGGDLSGTYPNPSVNVVYLAQSLTSITAGTWSGTTSTAVCDTADGFVCTAGSGVIKVTGSGTAGAAFQPIFTIAWTNAFPNTPICSFTPINSTGVTFFITQLVQNSVASSNSKTSIVVEVGNLSPPTNSISYTSYICR